MGPGKSAERVLFDHSVQRLTGDEAKSRKATPDVMFCLSFGHVPLIVLFEFHIFPFWN